VRPRGWTAVRESRTLALRAPPPAETALARRALGILGEMRPIGLALAASLVALPGAARAQEPAPIAPSQIHLDSDETQAATTTLPEAPPEAPPPPPRKKGVVLEGSMGALGFLGSFRHVAPPAVRLHAQLGWEFTRWLMVFGEGELAYTDTSELQTESATRTLPLYGVGAGLRVTAHATDRVAFFAQGSLGGLKADVPKNALLILGYGNAENFGLVISGRAGVEWYQVDRHMALGLSVELRDASGFAKLIGASDVGLMADASAAIRYTF